MFTTGWRVDRSSRDWVAACALALAAVAFAGCGGGEGGSRPEVARVPARAGVVWEVDSAASRSASPAALLAYVNGLHVVVVDGGDVYAGMTRLKATSTPDGGWELRLDDGLSAELRPAGDAMRLAFSTGEEIGMRRRADTEGD